MPSTHEVHRDKAHALQDGLFSEIYSTVEELSESEWQRSTNCPEWVVRDIVSHLARSAGTFTAMVDTGLRGEKTFALTQEERDRRERELASLNASQLLETLRADQDMLKSRLASLSEDSLLTLCPHSRGLQPAWWFADQRLSELTFHGWDLYHSLDREREIAPSVGQHLLPVLLERNVPTWHKTDESGSPRFVVLASDVDNGAWEIAPTSPGANVTRGISEGELTIQGPAAPLIRWLYGRAPLTELERAGTVSISGNPDLVGQWKLLFPSP
jgi:uncharacterized protein (TIGR03083 family)